MPKVSDVAVVVVNDFSKQVPSMPKVSDVAVVNEFSKQGNPSP